MSLQNQHGDGLEKWALALELHAEDRCFPHGARAREVDDEFVAMAQEKGLSFAPALGQAKTFWWVAEHPELFVRRMNEAGITVTVGSDSGAGNIAYGWGTHLELETLVEDGGLAPLEALGAAGAAAAAELTDDPDFGSIAEGNAADLVLLSADPLADIRQTRQIDRVMQAGVWLERGLQKFPVPEDQ